MIILKSDEIIRKYGACDYFYQSTLGRTLSNCVHSHDFYEIICVQSGECTQRINDKTHVMRRGDVSILRPGDTHTFTDQHPNTSIAALSVGCVEFEGFAASYGFNVDEHCPSVFALSQNDRIELGQYTELLVAIDDERKSSILKVFTGKIISVAVLISCSIPKKLTEHFSETLRRMENLENAARGIDAFLEISNFSHSQLCRLTNKYLNCTPGEYVNRIRMRYAWEYVTTSELDYESIAELVGIKSYSWFCKLFRLTYGVTVAKARGDSRSHAHTV